MELSTCGNLISAICAAIWNIRPTQAVRAGRVETAAPMVRLPGDSDRDFSARAKDDIDAYIAALLASPPPLVDELFADPIVQMKIAALIARAMNRQRGRNAG